MLPLGCLAGRKRRLTLLKEGLGNENSGHGLLQPWASPLWTPDVHGPPRRRLPRRSGVARACKWERGRARVWWKEMLVVEAGCACRETGGLSSCLARHSIPPPPRRLMRRNMATTTCSPIGVRTPFSSPPCPVWVSDIGTDNALRVS